jgi:hypothetical protein
MSTGTLVGLGGGLLFGASPVKISSYPWHFPPLFLPHRAIPINAGKVSGKTPGPARPRVLRSASDPQHFTTSIACKPFFPWAISNSTSSPSRRTLKPSCLIDEKCTNKSSPPSWEINPNPFCSLNHLTRPLGIAFTSLLLFSDRLLPAISRKKSRISVKSYAAFLFLTRTLCNFN